MEGEDHLKDFIVGSLPTLIYIPNFITDSDQDRLLHHIYQSPISKWKSLKNRRLQNWGGVVHEKGLLPQDWRAKADESLYRPMKIMLTMKFNRVCDTDSIITELRGHLDACKLLSCKSLSGESHLYAASLYVSCKLLTVPAWLMKITQKICEKTGLFPSPINHVLINEYLPDQGIMIFFNRLSENLLGKPHQDGPAYFPVVAILSLGSPVVMNFTPHPRLRSRNGERGVSEESNSDERAVEIGINEHSKDMCRPIDDHHRLSILLMPHSLLIFKDAVYSDYLHGIEDTNIHSLDEVVNVAEVLKYQEQISSLSSEQAARTNIAEQHSAIHRTTTRVSLTCRLVLKVHKNLFKF